MLTVCLLRSWFCKKAGIYWPPSGGGGSMAFIMTFCAEFSQLKRKIWLSPEDEEGMPHLHSEK
jgi:hypothetical protein